MNKDIEFFKWHEIYKCGGEYTEVMICAFTGLLKVSGYDHNTSEIACVSVVEIDKESAIYAVKNVQ